MKIFKGNLFYKLDFLIIIIFFLGSWLISRDKFIEFYNISSGAQEKFAKIALKELDKVSLSKINSKNIFTLLNPLKSIEEIKKETRFLENHLSFLKFKGYSDFSSSKLDRSTREYLITNSLINPESISNCVQLSKDFELGEEKIFYSYEDITKFFDGKDYKSMIIPINLNKNVVLSGSRLYGEKRFFLTYNWLVSKKEIKSSSRPVSNLGFLSSLSDLFPLFSASDRILYLPLSDSLIGPLDGFFITIINKPKGKNYNFPVKLKHALYSPSCGYLY